MRWKIPENTQATRVWIQVRWEWRRVGVDRGPHPLSSCSVHRRESSSVVGEGNQHESDDGEKRKERH